MNKFLLALVFSSAWMLCGQGIDTVPSGMETEPAAFPSAEAPRRGTALESDLDSLSALFESLRAREKEQEALHERLQAAGDDIQRAAIRRELEETIEAVESLRQQFQRIALASDVSMFEKTVEESFDWQKEIVQFIRPVLNELKNMTAESREVAELQSHKEELTRRRNAAKSAMDNIDRLLQGEPDEELAARLRQMRETWRSRHRETVNQLTAVDNQLSQRLSEREDVFDRTRGAASNFVQTRGRNLFFGVIAFLAVFLSMKYAYKLIRKAKPVSKRGRTLYTRLFTLIWTLLGVIFAMGATLMVFNAVGDLFLLSLTLVFLVGLCWAGMKTLPQFVEQFRMMLNMGAIKEDERLWFDGIPWKVDSISFATQLVNPLLDGGYLTIPTRMLVGLHSRPLGKKEEWFPSREKDWVLLSDGTYGRITYQTPATVQVVQPGGSQKVIPTPKFMDLAPVNLSTGFRREVIFGLDYGLQSIAVTEIPDKMTAHLKALLDDKLGKALQYLRVDLHEAADSSINFVVMVDCGPDAGQHWMMIPRWIQTALVDLCNREGWSIPFPQLQLHTRNRS
ncbi:MAG: hypothetical protein JJU29_22520 [Verrucomicrobia bacterium]|nr:hypothetical protein [Verrucomicrobiota bacterium]MCH8513057.1 hypothetical protein [Kiritimatiellia bacterium]